MNPITIKYKPRKPRLRRRMLLERMDIELVAEQSLAKRQNKTK